MLLVGLLWSQLTSPWRLGVAVGLVPVCVLLTWEGGLFFIPSAVALIIASISTRPSAPA